MVHIMANNSANNSPNNSMNRSIQDNVHYSSGKKKNRPSSSSFQIVKCNKCQIQITKNNLSKHEEMNERSCAHFIQSFFQLSNHSMNRFDESILKNRLNLFEHPFLIGDDILYTSSIGKFIYYSIVNLLLIFFLILIFTTITAITTVSSAITSVSTVSSAITSVSVTTVDWSSSAITIT